MWSPGVGECRDGDDFILERKERVSLQEEEKDGKAGIGSGGAASWVRGEGLPNVQGGLARSRGTTIDESRLVLLSHRSR